MSKRPSFQFYPADWRNDAALRMCSPGARGLWIDMLCVMHDGIPYGHLTSAGIPIAADELARIVGGSTKEVKRWLDELGKRQVYSVTDSGVIYSRRMVRDENERDGWRDRQAKSRAKPNGVTPPITSDVTAKSQRSSSSSSSSGSVSEVETGAFAPPHDQPNGSGKPAKPAKPDDPWKEIYDRGKAVLGREAGGIITLLRKLYDDKPRKVLAKIEDAAEQREPLKWICAFLHSVDDGGKLSGEYIGGVPP